MSGQLQKPMRNNGIGGHTRPYQGRSNDWLTPPGLIKALGEFYMDPCAAPSPRPWPTARHMIEPPSNGLEVPWKHRVWLNPPYGPETEKWLMRLAYHGNGIALTFARTETHMFKTCIWERADAVLFKYERLYFFKPTGERASGNSGGPSILVAYGKQNARALYRSGIKGACMARWRA